MSLYLSHRGAFTHHPLKCRAVPRCLNVRRMARAACTYGRPWYLPQGWLSDLLEDLNILWARENWICQWSCAFTARLIPGLWYRHVSLSLSMSKDAPTVRWERTEMTPTLSHGWDWDKAERKGVNHLCHLVDHHVKNKSKTLTGMEIEISLW